MIDGTDGDGSGVQARMAFCTVNSHCLENLVRLTQHCAVSARCAIVDVDGATLLAAGATLSSAQQPALRRRRLRIPLEACLDVESELSLASVVDDALGLLDATPALGLVGGAAGARQGLRALAGAPLDAPLKLLLSVAQRTAPADYRRALAAMVVSAGLADGLRLGARDGELLILAALLQDIGEAYIDPELLSARAPLPLAQWYQIAAHPLVSEALLIAFGGFSPALAECVAQHHERQDGSGYPQARHGATMDPLAALAGVADCVAAVLCATASDGASGCRSWSERVALALGIVADEYPPAAVAFINDALAPLAADGEAHAGGSFAQLILPTLQQIRSARLLADALASRADNAELRSCAADARAAIVALDKRLRATGVYDIAQLGQLESDAQRMGRIGLMLAEIRWRLRQLARRVYLCSVERGGERATAPLLELVAALNAA